MYKLVAIDLDGTLLNSYGEVSEKNKEAIQKAKNKGAEIVIASGRLRSGYSPRRESKSQRDQQPAFSRRPRR